MRMKTIVSPGRELTKLHYCLFPDDYEFERETLVQLWMAVGFLGDIHMEDAGNLRFDALLEGQYILLARIDILTGKNKYKVNYDKVTNLLNGIQTLQNKDLRAMLEDEDASVVGSKFWHVSVVSNHIDQATFETLKTFNELRTLLFVRNYGSSLKQIPSDLFLALKSIQALDLSGSHITKLPSSIDFDVLGQLTCMPKGMGALTELRILSTFIVDLGEGCSIRELQHMNNLKGSFCISRLENVTQREAQEATLSTLSDKKYLTQLQLRWNDFKLYSVQDLHCMYWSTHYLKPNLCLEELQVLYYPGLNLPALMGSPEYERLVSITLLKCAIKELRIRLGELPNLKYLKITLMYKLTDINRLVHAKDGIVSFPKFETLLIDGMPQLDSWIRVTYGDFPLLFELIVRQCPKLSVLLFLPHLPSLRHLEISHCKVLKSLSDGPTLSTSLETLVIDACPLLKKRYMRGGEGWFEIEHIPDITIELKNVRSTQEDGADDDTSSA
uniref:Uncharacterized protein n=1 Tax=Chenopodium quinoa TaxID=63459 RepID=A0A803LT77_CHEQI